MKPTRLVFVLAFASLSGACSPIYDTVYSFTPPATSFGRECIDGCDDSKSECEQFEHDRAEFCERHQQDLMDRCAERISREKNRAPKITECGKTESCVASTERCEGGYRSCYAACGGTVTAKQECVAFCGDAK